MINKIQTKLYFFSLSIFIILTDQITKENGIELQLPGGGSNENESLIRALYREVIEEPGWGIKVLKK